MLLSKSLRSIRRQTSALVQKNVRIFAKFYLTTLVRALIFPVLVAVLLCLATKLQNSNLLSGFVDSSGFAIDSRPIKSLADAIGASSTQKLVFVRNGIAASDIDPVINGTMSQPGMGSNSHTVIDDPTDLYWECQQTVRGLSDCFAAVIFTSYNATTAQYIIAVDGAVGRSDADYQSHTSVAINRLMPLKWAVDSQIGNFTAATRPAEQPWQGYLASKEEITDVAKSYVREQPNFWLVLIDFFVAPIFILTFMGIVYHLSLTVATERQSGISELLAAHTCSTAPRMLSTQISFTLLYLPSWIICSVLFTRLLFTHCSDILFLFLSILAGLSIASSSYFVASFFRKAQLSGLYTSVLMFALAFVTIAFTLSENASLVAIEALSAIFPPITYITLVGDVVRAEILFTSFSLSASDLPAASQDGGNIYPQFAGYLYIVFFTLQIAVYTTATFGVEKWLWGVKRPIKIIDAKSDTALRCTKLSKTFASSSKSPAVAVDCLDLELKKGSVTFLLGPNGCGKTTTLKCIAGMTVMDLTSSLEINEDDLAFGVCPQGNVFWPSLTVLENINIWRKIKTATMENTEDEDDVLVECDLLDKIHSAAKSLSGGQMRKLQMAIAFVGGSRICCIDEASSGLDPLSRRNIWNIISKGRARRTVLMTTHFLDEADVLADHITIMYKGKMVCAGTATGLKVTYGDNYTISEIQLGNERGKARTWQIATSADATRQLLELEGISNNSYSVAFPTLEQAFLRVTDSKNIIQGVTGDIAIQEKPAEQIDEALSTDIHHKINDFDAGQGTTFLRQIGIILRKRYILLQHNWISFVIALAAPIIVAGALSSVLHYLPPFVPCQKNLVTFTNGAFTESKSSSSQPANLAPLDKPSTSQFFYRDTFAIVGPPPAFQGRVQDELYVFSTEQFFAGGEYDTYTSEGPLNTRMDASTLDAAIEQIKGLHGAVGFGVFAATADNTTILHQISPYASPDISLAALSVVANRIANASTATGLARKVQTSYQTFRQPDAGADYRLLPLTLLVLLGLITSTAVAINYPTYERVNNMRALQYCNGVSPVALWIAYWIFDMLVIIVTTLITWGLIFTGNGARLWFAPSYILGAMILFGWASCLGAYVLSAFIRRAAFAVAAGVHVVLFVFYILAYALNQYIGSPRSRSRTYDQLQAGMGLTSPAANLGRAFFITSNNYDLACGETGYNVQNPFAFNLYGGVYLYLILQIILLSGILYLIEYGSLEWFHKLSSKKSAPSGTSYSVVEQGSSKPTMNDKTSNSNAREQNASADAALVVSNVSKQFGKITAVENLSFNISADETLALLGANGAGKTTAINMIRGLIKPNIGSIHLDGISVVDNPRKARVHIGVCPQDDAIDELTVRQTLNFFAAIKGVKNVKINVEKIMDAFGIRGFEGFAVKKLSGGTRRKLMVAIALIGNPRVLLLDEPSTGLDAGAKRVLWAILHSLSAGRAILLTTHSMEEVESLATKVTILGTRMLASGSLASLRSAYGGFYRIRASYDPSVLDADAERLTRDAFGAKAIEVINLVARYGQVSFEVPHEVRRLGSIMEIMEGLLVWEARSLRAQEDEIEVVEVGERGLGHEERERERDNEMGFKEYTIAEPTMEMIFMNVCMREGREKVLGV